ncbi:unnamed protein product [Phytomonas sp. Hart1]|nr:unnamed protein product [Phytomonas sp. Hart1]|eukprot:CCW69976.1 unnamed protein product [Phytomonas sp. isolate Hart1]
MVSFDWWDITKGGLRLVAIVDDLLHVLFAVVVVATVVVGLALSRNVYRSMLRTRAMRNDLEEKTLSRESRVYLGAIEAEGTVEEVLRKAGWSRVYLRRRVPVSRIGHNREIDVIAVGKVILVVEVKHWQGYVWSNGPRWFQMPVRMKHTLEFEDVMEDNVVKAAALRRFIENTHRIALPDLPLLSREGEGAEKKDDHNYQTVSFSNTGQDKNSANENDSSPEDALLNDKKDVGTWYTDKSLHKQCGLCVLPIVVFTNPRVKLDPATVKAKKFVFTLNDFRIFAREALRGNFSLEAPNEVVAWRKKGYLLLPPFLRRLLSPFHVPSEAALGSDLQQQIGEAIENMRTWDLVRLHNGRLIVGDVQKIDAPSANCIYERKELLEINFQWNYGAVGLLKSFLSNRGGTVELVLTTAKRLAIKKKEKKTQDWKGNIIFPIVPNNRRLTLNDRLSIKSPGTPKLITLALSNIKEVHLSRHLYELEKGIEVS